MTNTRGTTSKPPKATGDPRLSWDEATSSSSQPTRPLPQPTYHAQQSDPTSGGAGGSKDQHRNQQPHPTQHQSALLARSYSQPIPMPSQNTTWLPGPGSYNDQQAFHYSVMTPSTAGPSSLPPPQQQQQQMDRRAAPYSPSQLPYPLSPTNLPTFLPDHTNQQAYYPAPSQFVQRRDPHGYPQMNQGHPYSFYQPSASRPMSMPGSYPPPRPGLRPGEITPSDEATSSGFGSRGRSGDEVPTLCPGLVQSEEEDEEEEEGEEGEERGFSMEEDGDASSELISPIKELQEPEVPWVRPVHTPRPPNAWILYRSDKLRAIAAGETSAAEMGFVEGGGGDSGVGTGTEESTSAESKGKESAGGKKKKKKGKKNGKGLPQADISKLISDMWKREPREIKGKYEKLAEVKKMEHQAMYPDYKFQPMKKEDKERLKVERDKEKAAMKKEKALTAKARVRKSRAKVKPATTSSYGQSTIPAQPAEESNYPPLLSPTGQGLQRAKSNTNVPGGSPKSQRGVGTRGRGEAQGYQYKSTGVMDGAQVFWGIPPDLPGTHGYDVNGNPAGPPHREMIPRSTSAFLPFEQRQHPQHQGPGGHPEPQQQHPTSRGPDGHPQQLSPQTPQMQPEGGEWEYQDHQEMYHHPPHPHHLHYAHPVPPPQHGYAVDQGSYAIPYIFEPVPFHGQVGQQYAHPGQHEEMLQYAPPQGGEASVFHGEIEAGPLAGISASDLTEMWCLLEEDAVQNGQKAGEWQTDAGEALSGWAELGVPIEDPNAYQQVDLSANVAGQIAANWAMESSRMQPQPQAGPSTSVETPAGPSGTASEPQDAHDQPIMSYERPGYLTIQVPIESIQDYSHPLQGIQLRPENSGMNNGPFLTTVQPTSPDTMVFGAGTLPNVANGQRGGPQYNSIGQQLDDDPSRTQSEFDPTRSAPGGDPVPEAARYVSNSAYPTTPLSGEAGQEQYADYGYSGRDMDPTLLDARNVSGISNFSQANGAPRAVSHSRPGDDSGFKPEWRRPSSNLQPWSDQGLVPPSESLFGLAPEGSPQEQPVERAAPGVVAGRGRRGRVVAGKHVSPEKK